MTQEKLEEAKRLYQTANADQKYVLESLFPELAEREDEKIRKRLIEFVKQSSDLLYPPNQKSMLAWLEAQGAQKPSAIRWYDASLIPQEMEELLVEWDSEDATWHEIAFYHADTKTFWDGTIQVENVTRWCYIIDLLEKQGEQKPQRMISAEAKEALFDYENANIQQKDFAPKVEPKFKVGDIIKPKDRGHEPWQIMQVDILDKKYRFKDGYVIHFSQENDYELVEQKPSEWSEDLVKQVLLQEVLPCFMHGGEADELVAKLDEVMSTKVIAQPQQEWSEEDEHFRLMTLGALVTCKTEFPTNNVDEQIRWLKSLKERYTWKPSDEQMEALSSTMGDSTSIHYSATLHSLYNDLKKLKGG